MPIYEVRDYFNFNFMAFEYGYCNFYCDLYS